MKDLKKNILIDIERIRTYIKEGDLDKAIMLSANAIVISAVVGADKSEIYYLLGNAYRKKGEFHTAIKYYDMAIAENPETPAVEALKTLQGIMSFYNKDMYNH